MRKIQDTAPPIVPDHELIRCVGSGSYGEVWLARSVMGTFRAVKIVRRESFDEARPFEREFEGISRYEPVSRLHPGWVDILHIGRGTDYFYYVMELADDLEKGMRIDPGNYTPRTLGRILNRRGRLPFEECLEIGLSLAAALEHLHLQGLVHRDIKPSNIIFVHDTPKFADIGLVTRLGESATFVGTAGYIAPEGPGRAQADLYSLGKVLYETAMGKDTDQFPELPTAFLELPEAPDLARLNEIILQACHPDPARRLADAGTMRMALQSLHAGAPGKRAVNLGQSSTALASSKGCQAVILMSCGLEDVQPHPDYLALIEALQRRGVEVFSDPCPAPSVDWARQLEGHIRRAHLVLAVTPPSASPIDMVVYGLEWARQIAAQHKGRPRIAAVRVGTEPLAPWPPWAALVLEDKPILNWTGPHDEQRFCDQVMELLDKPEE